MRYGKIIICFFTAAFIACAIYWGRQEPKLEQSSDPWASLSILIPSDGKSEKVSCWENRDGAYFMFLPSYADLSETTLWFDGKAAISIDGQPMRNGMDCSSFQLDKPYELLCTMQGRKFRTTLTFLQSGNIPAMYIDTLSGNMDYVHASKENQEPGNMRLYRNNGELASAIQIESISGRGNSTWDKEKKPYNLSLAHDADLLNMGASQKWILLANSRDSSNLRNKIVYDFAQKIGMDYSPQCQWIDLYLNGEYVGLYLLSTRNEIHPQRIAISQTNSFLVSMELQWRLEIQRIPFVKTNCSSWLAFRIQDSTINETILRETLQSMENAILAEDGIDPVTGKYYQELIDVDSWAARYLIDEVFSNYDGGSLSQFFYFDGDSGSDKVYAGPVWDMDNCLSWGGYLPNAIWAGRPHLWDSTDKPLFYSLWQKEDFRQRVLALYRQKFLPALADLLNSGIQEYVDTSHKAAYLNSVRWDMGDAAENAAYIHSYIEKRIDFLNAYYWGDTPYCIVQISNPDAIWSCYAVPYGGYLEQYIEYADTESGRYLGYYTLDTDEPFDPSMPIYSDVMIYPKWEPIGNESVTVPQTKATDIQLFLPIGIAAPLTVFLGILTIMLVTDFRNIGKNGGRKSGNR